MALVFFGGIAVFVTAFVVPLLAVHRLNPVVRRLAFFLTAAGCLMFLVVGVYASWTGVAIEAGSYGFSAGLSLAFTIDRLAGFFIAIVSIVAFCAAIYSIRYTEHLESAARRNVVASVSSLFVLAMLLVVSAANSFCLLVFWEVMSLSSFFLVMVEHEKAEVQKAGIFYFVMTQMSTMFLLGAIIVIYEATGSFDLNAAGTVPAVAFAFVFAGFGIKAGVVPFHKWLPYAHSASPSNVSALMSGVMIKVAIYGMLRYLLTVMVPELWWGIVILVFGTISALLGVVYALKEHDLKKLLAYHSIENIGIILIGIGLYIIFGFYGLAAVATLSLAGALFHTLNHAIFKSLLFLTAGSVVEATGTRSIEEMGGLIKVMPRTGIFFLVGAAAISALPPLNGFVSELMIFQAFFQSYLLDNPLMQTVLFVGLALFALTSALAAACFVKAFGIVFLGAPRSTAASSAHEAGWPMLAGPLILALLCAVLGVFSRQILQAAGYDLPVPDLAITSLVLLVFGGITVVIVRALGKGRTRIAETWGCGIPEQTGQMEYTASGFSEPILTIFAPIYRTRRELERRWSDMQHVVFKSGRAEIHTFKLFEERIYMPAARAVQWVSDRVAALQDVDLETQILYVFGTVVLLVILTWML